MPIFEKHGGLWLDDVESGYRLIFENYDTATDLIGAVHFKPPNTFRASVFEKSVDPQWKLPFWAECSPDVLFTDKSEAIAHIQTLLGRRGGT